MKSFVKISIVVALALILGVGSALWVIHYPPVKPGVRNGAWQTNLEVGGVDADMYLRAYIARIGLFALNKTETVYYHANADSSGEPLTSNCDYRIEGESLPTRWWAITVYGEDHFLIPNPQKRYSFNKNDVKRSENGSYSIYISRAEKDGDWIPAGEKKQRLSLTLRLYNPEPVIYEQPAKVPLPRIIEEGCR